MEKKVIIVGAGLVGSLWAIYMSKAGYKVTIYERRSDIRKAEISAGKSINLALSYRGWKALRGAGVDDEVKKIALPMYNRIMHDSEGNLTTQPYGKKNQAIYSVSRGLLNSIMMTMAEEKGNAEIHYNYKCYDADLENGIVYFEDALTGEKKQDQADLVFAADGAFSAIRYNAMQKLNRFNYSQNFIEDGYKELLLPANEDGSYKLDKKALHIWPRGRFMLIALPNEDGSFTCTLFMPYDNHEYAFNKLTNDTLVDAFFKNVFPDFHAIMPNLIENWHMHPLSSLAIVRCYPWTYGKTALMGDSAHATVPFYGQGMNAGFEDCTVLWDLMKKHNEDWEKVFSEYQQTHKPNGDALQDLSLHNYHVMRDYVADPKFLLQKKIEARIFEKHPDKWMPLYSQVTFSHIPYSEAIAIGKKQDKIMKEILKTPNIEEVWDSENIENKILNFL
ncbi:MAG: NAD(P)/FAD-dependent oxidoreductase [Bacteroidota bacterium]|nr:NAD(P)/FAD-dependent oxidoreductase [Bacteroidota bacterium]